MTETTIPRSELEGRYSSLDLPPRGVDGPLGVAECLETGSISEAGIASDDGSTLSDDSRRRGLRIGRPALVVAALLTATPSVVAASNEAPSNHGPERLIIGYGGAVKIGEVALSKTPVMSPSSEGVATEQQLFQGLICNGRKPKVLRNNRTMKLYCSSSVEYMPFWRQCKQGDVPACRTFMAETRVWSRRAERGTTTAWKTIRPVVRWLRSEAAEAISPN